MGHTKVAVEGTIRGAVDNKGGGNANRLVVLASTCQGGVGED